MSVIRSASLALILSTSLTLGACSPKDKGKSATKSAAAKMLGLTAPGDEVFARHFNVPDRNVGESEAEQALAALGLLNPSKEGLNWAAKDGAAGNYTYNNLSAESDEGMVTVSAAKLYGAHMDGETASFDRADFEGVKIYNEDEDVTMTVDALSIVRPSPAMAKSIVAALSELSEIDDLDESFEDKDMGFGAMALNNVKVESPEANGSINSLVWGTDEETKLSDMKLEGLNFKIMPKNEDDYGTMTLKQVSVTELNTELYKNHFGTTGLSQNPFGSVGLWGKTFDTFKLEELDFDSTAFSFKTKGIEGKAKQKGEVTTIVQATEPMIVKIKEPKDTGGSFQQRQAYEAFAELGFDEMVFQSSQTSVMDTGKDLIDVKEGSFTLKDGFDISYNYQFGGADTAMKTLNAAAGSRNQDAAMDALKTMTLNGFELRLEDNSIIDRAFNLAAKMQGSSAGALRTQAKLGLRLAPLAAQGVEGEMLGAVAGALSEFIDGDKTLSLIMSPKEPLPLASLAELKKGSMTFEELGFSAKAE